MMKLVLLLVFVCFQFSRAEELSEFEQVKDVAGQVPLNEENDPDYDTYDSNEEPLTGESTFNSAWLRKKVLAEERSHNRKANDPDYDTYDSNEEPLTGETTFNSAWLRNKLVAQERSLNREANDPDYDTYDSNEEPLTGESTFNSAWLRRKLFSEERSHDMESKFQSILDKLTAIAEMIADYSDEDYSFDSDDDDDDDDDSYWNIIHELIENARYKKSQKNKNGQTLENTEVPSVASPPSLSDDEARHPVKRFTSV